MKWMWSTAIVIVAASVAVAAQSASDMGKPMKNDKMSKTYTGCVESVNHGSSFLLTHLADDHQAMKHDMAMMKDDMTMKKDMGGKDQTGGASDMSGDHMMPSALMLTGLSDAKKHVGQKVTVMGSVSMGSMRDDLDTLTVSSLKVVAKSCS